MIYDFRKLHAPSEPLSTRKSTKRKYVRSLSAAQPRTRSKSGRRILALISPPTNPMPSLWPYPDGPDDVSLCQSLPISHDDDNVSSNPTMMMRDNNGNYGMSRSKADSLVDKLKLTMESQHNDYHRSNHHHGRGSASRSARSSRKHTKQQSSSRSEYLQHGVHQSAAEQKRRSKLSNLADLQFQIYREQFDRVEEANKNGNSSSSAYMADSYRSKTEALSAADDHVSNISNQGSHQSHGSNPSNVLNTVENAQANPRGNPHSSFVHQQRSNTAKSAPNLHSAASHQKPDAISESRTVTKTDERIVEKRKKVVEMEHTNFGKDIVEEYKVFITTFNLVCCPQTVEYHTFFLKRINSRKYAMRIRKNINDNLNDNMI